MQAHPTGFVPGERKFVASAHSLPTPEHLHARYGTKIGRRIKAALGSDHEGEDLVQEVFITILSKLDTVRDPACLDGWVAQVTNNTVRHMIRQRRLRRQLLGEWLEGQGPALFHVNADALDVASRAIDAMYRLSANDRSLLSAHWFTPGTAETIARQSGCSVNTLRRRLTKARARFQKMARRSPALAQYMAEGKRPQSPASAGLE
jgi:RNA polymerase sigma-70 factor (ECF subfamily)